MGKKKKRRLKKKVKIGLGIIVTVLVLSLAAVLVIPRLNRNNNNTYEEVAVLCIDPGHGGYDGGTIGADGSAEKDIDLAIALAIGEEIQNIDPRITVIYTRTSDEVTWPENEEEDLMARVDYAAENNADYFLSVHMNSNDDPTVYGYEFYTRQNDTFSQEVCNRIASNLDDAGWLYNRGIIYTEDYPLYVVSEQTIPAMLLEAGFMSNYSECVDLQQSFNQRTIAQAVAQAYVDSILEELGLDPLPTEEEEEA